LKKRKQNIGDLLANKPELQFITEVLSNKSIGTKQEKLSTKNSNLIPLNLSPFDTESFNNKEFIRLIKHHRLDSIFYKAVQEQNIKLAPELDERLEQINKRNKMRMMKLTAELIRIHKLFTENNIDYINLKGPALSQQIYGDYTVRSSRDLDILVRIEDFTKASYLLKSIDYKNNKKFNSINKFNYKEYKFPNSKTNLLVELHHRLFNNKYLLPISNSVFINKESININNNDISILPSSINFEYIALHAAAHNWKRMHWALDVLLLKETYKNITLDKELTLLNNSSDYKLKDYILNSKEKQLQLLGQMLHLLKLRKNSNYKFHEILQRLFIPYRFLDKT